MLDATLLYGPGKIHLISARWSEDLVFCSQVASHAVLGSEEFRSPEKFTRSVHGADASMSNLRSLLSQEGDRHVSQALSNDQVLRQAALMLAQGRLKAIVCRTEENGAARLASSAPPLNVLRFHLQIGLDAHSVCPYGLDHRIRTWEELESARDFVQLLFQRREFIPELKRLAFADGDGVSENEEVIRSRLEHLLRSGRLVVIECPGVASQSDEEERQAERARRAQQAPQQRRPDTVKTKPEKMLKTWVEIKLIDDKGKPVPNEKYLLVLPDGSNVEGTLDAQGWARQDEIDPGTCRVCFPSIDRRTWHPA